MLHNAAENTYHGNIITAGQAQHQGLGGSHLRGGGDQEMWEAPEGTQEEMGRPALLPLSGFPIGAGPEGDSHAGPFEQCDLYRYGLGLGDSGDDNRDEDTAHDQAERGRDINAVVVGGTQAIRELEERRCSSVSF